jgi:hypothetical protein
LQAFSLLFQLKPIEISAIFEKTETGFSDGAEIEKAFQTVRLKGFISCLLAKLCSTNLAIHGC